LFFPALGEGRTIESFSNSLKNSRDSFDSWLRKSGRVGWRDEDSHSEPAPLSAINKAVDVEFASLSRSDVWSLIEPYTRPAEGGIVHPQAIPPNITVSGRWRDDLVDDLQKILDREIAEPTTRKALIDARIGQGGFRENVLGIWENSCAVTGCTIMEVIRASHVVPWCDCADKERLDPFNGLPLVANLDALFDAGLISFDDYGEIVISSHLPQAGRETLGLGSGRLRTSPPSEMIPYLRRHRESYFRR
jgi:hypothetical protein